MNEYAKVGDIAIAAILISLINMVIGAAILMALNENTSVIKTDLFTLRTAINANSCFHLELPPSDNHEQTPAKGNRKANSRGFKANNKKDGKISR